MKAFFSKFRRLDWVMFACMLLLVRMGIRLIQSAGGARTSAALQDLWTVHAWTAAIGLACGAGMYDCVIIVLVILVVVLDVIYPLEGAFKRRLRNMTIYVEFTSIEYLDEITDAIRGENATVYDIDVERTKREGSKYPAAVIVLQINLHQMDI